MKTIAKALCAVAIAALAGGCQTTAETPEAQQWPSGQWKGSNRFRTQIETRIEAVQEDRRVQGTACWWETSGVISGQRLDSIATLSETGLSLRFDIGKGIFHIQHDNGRKATMWEARVRDDTTLTRPLRTRLTRTAIPGCTARYRAEPQAPAPVPTNPSEPMLGHWSAEKAEATVAEMSITEASAKKLEAMYCTRGEKGEIRIFDLVRRGPLKPRLDAKGHTLTFEERLRHGRKNRFTFAVHSADEARLTITHEARGTANRSTTLTLRRGARTDGCIAQTTARHTEETKG